MGILANMLAVKAVEEGVGRIGIGLRPPRSQAGFYRAVVRLADPQEGELEEEEIDDDLSAAILCSLYGGGG
jgi:hypothetical protein